MVEAFNHFRPYLLNSEKSIIIFTDARALIWVSRNREFSIECNGLVNKLARIQLEIPHMVYSVPSEVNYLADVFSRSFNDTVGDKYIVRNKNIASPTYAGVFMPKMIKNCQFFLDS